MQNNSIDNTPDAVVSRITLTTPDLETLRKARRWLQGAAMLLADASNGCAMVERIACEASTVALMAEVAIFEYTDNA